MRVIKFHDVTEIKTVCKWSAFVVIIPSVILYFHWNQLVKKCMFCYLMIIGLYYKKISMKIFREVCAKSCGAHHQMKDYKVVIRYIILGLMGHPVVLENGVVKDLVCLKRIWNLLMEVGVTGESKFLFLIFVNFIWFSLLMSYWNLC